jgi:hypothetical protein
MPQGQGRQPKYSMTIGTRARGGGNEVEAEGTNDVRLCIIFDFLFSLVFQPKNNDFRKSGSSLP